MKKLTIPHAKISAQNIEGITQRLEKYFRRGLKSRDVPLRFLSVSVLVLCIIYTVYCYQNLNAYIPLWYTKTWGEAILAPRIQIFLIPVISALFTATAQIFAYLSKKLYFTFLSQLLLTATLIFNSAAFLNIIRISYVSSQTPKALLNIPPQTQTLIMLLILGFVSSFLILPRFISWAFKKGLVTDPIQHKHPGMILTRPSARGGGFVFSVIFSFLVILFLERSMITVGISLAVLISGIIGLLDDFQNTSVKSKWKFMENPLIRLLVFLPVPVVIMIAFGIVSGYINNPFDGSLSLTDLSFNFFGKSIVPLPYIFTFVWTLAIMNMISWSNGVDGQFGGISGIALIIIGLLALRLVQVEPSQLTTAKVAFLAAGICFGFIPHTWHPSKIMWGFGAVSLGLLLSSLSIVSRAKVATTVLVILIPFLDGFVTGLRRIIQGKNPLKGDRGHLHHLLLERGWSPQKVSVFYWVTTASFGVIGLLSADKSPALVTLTLGGLVASLIIFMNINSRNGKHKTKESLIDKETLQQLG